MAKRKKKEEKKSYPWFTAPAVALLIAAVFSRSSVHNLFLSLETSRWSAYVLTEDTPFPGPVLWFYFRMLLKVFCLDYIIPTWVFLFPALLLFSVGLSAYGDRFELAWKRLYFLNVVKGAWP